MGDHLRRYRDRLADTASGRLGAIQRGASRLATSVAPESDALALADRLRDYAMDMRALRAIDEALALAEVRRG